MAADGLDSGLMALARDRDPDIYNAARWLQVNPNLAGGLPTAMARLFEGLAVQLLHELDDDPELTRALVALTQAKDHVVRCAIANAEPNFR